MVEKTNLTQDVFELVFEGSEKLTIKPGQFITFLLPVFGGRAYSILEIDEEKVKLIIKRVEDGRGGSKFICDSQIGDILKGVGPAGHFVLKENTKNKLFIGTGTGFVPLYNQIISGLKQSSENKLKLIFGVRTEKDLFYIEQLNSLKQENKNFDFEIYLSRDEVISYNKGYVTDFLTKQNIEDFEEVYICGAPNMIDSSIEILKNLGFDGENIFIEKY